MSYIADYENEFDLWNFILGDFYQGMSIATDRYYFLEELNNQHSIKIALRDPYSDYWTKWMEFPGLLWNIEKGSYGIKFAGLSAAVDVHRSIMPNEIIIESDYPTYEENYDAARLIGKIIEDKGFQPLYYYSGNKSVHIHVFFDWECIRKIDPILMDQLRILFKESKLRFQRKFMEWLRTKMITCWDTNVKKFDSELIKGTHLIRCELSKNKKGFKTFLGYSYKDMSFIPYICNETNRIYPKLGKIKLSSPEKIQELVEEFMDEIRVKRKSEIARKRQGNLLDWGIGQSETIRECVKSLMGDDFQKIGDGYQRAMFILVNEFRRVHGEAQAKILIQDWNAKMGFPVKESEIDYRFKTKNYSLSCKYIHKFLEELGIDISKKCKGKI